jgi:apolipoprotein N-acyltransferase
MPVLTLSARFPLRTLLALFLGALHAASFIDDATWPLQIATLAGLVALTLRAAGEADGPRAPRRAAAAGARIGFAFGLGWFLVGISWIYISLHTYGELAAPLAAAAVFAFCAYLALYPALACAAFAAFRRRYPVRGALEGTVVVLGFASVWTLSELARGYVMTGFPWLASGYAHVGGPLAGYAPIFGVYGVSMAAAAIAAALAVGARLPRVRGPALTFLLVTVLGLPFAGTLLRRIEWTAPTGKPISVRLLQGNVSQDIKFEPSHFDSTADAYLEAIEAHRADLIVLPETAFPVFLADLPEAIGVQIARDAQQMHADIAFGIAVEEDNSRYYNSVIAISPGSERGDPDVAAQAAGADPLRIVTQRYSKSHLVPFGEFVPYGFHWFVRMLNIPLGDFNRGDITQAPMELAGLKVAFNICYEDLFGEEIMRQAVDANVLVNVSNVAWFGDSMALPQHLDISRMRALETGRPMLRATNTGMTAWIDPRGRVLGVLKPFIVGALDANVQGMTGLTPFLRLGNATVVILVVVAAALALALARRALRTTLTRSPTQSAA